VVGCIAVFRRSAAYLVCTRRQGQKLEQLELVRWQLEREGEGEGEGADELPLEPPRSQSRAEWH